ncbi:NACHT domain-containing protein [Streptomyces griseorubiginosus]|uniref:NACHT domain-containing protein n=1 Tax=Streptomyces griseorubiginosus TaxID=67304 RepID=UPI0036854F99
MVDGLDEIADHDARTDVIHTIAQHARAGSDYRFVVTTRPLPEAELAPLRSPLIGAYEVEPFDAAELRDFAGKWFATQFEYDEERARASTDRFLRETQDGRLRELVRNPLLATIAAVNATVDPSRPLPTSRLSLYERFCSHLLTRGATPATVRTELNRRFRDDPERRSFHLWIDEQKHEVLSALGRCRMEGEASLSEAAWRWVQEHAGERCLPGGWQVEIREFLQGTGLLVPVEDDYRFLHHSFAEFVAAQSYAREIPPNFPDVERWIQRALKGDERTFVMFVFCMWSERAGCKAEHITNQLMQGTRGGYERTLLAGLLLAEGVSVRYENRKLVIDRLEAIARGADADESEKALEVMGALGGEASVLERVKRMAASELLDPVVRLFAVEAFSQAGDAGAAELLLSSVLGGIFGALPKAADVACSIGQDAREAVRRRAWDAAQSPLVNSVILARVAVTLERLGYPQEVSEVARKVLEDPKAEESSLKEAVEAWIKAIPADAITISQLALDRPLVDQQGRATVAKSLEEFGELEAAVRLAGEVLASGTPDTKALKSAAQTWIKVRGASGVPMVMEAFANSSADVGHDLDVPSALLKTVAVFAKEAEIVDWAREVLGEHRWGVYEGGGAVAAWLAAGGSEVAGEIMARIGRGKLLEGYARAEAAEAMFDAGARREAGELAECALRTPNLSKNRYERSASVLLKVEGDCAGTKLEDIWRESSGIAVNSAWLHGVLVASYDHEAEIPLTDSVTCRFARELLDLDTVESDDVLLALEIISELEGRKSIPYIMEIVKGKVNDGLTWTDFYNIARGLAAMGERDSALEIWRHAIGLSLPPLRSDIVLLTDIQAAEATKEAMGWLRELIADPSTYPPRRLRLRQMLAWLAVAEPSLTEDLAEPGATGQSHNSDLNGGVPRRDAHG